MSKYEVKTDRTAKRNRFESIIIVGHFNTHLSEMDRFNSHKISKDIAELN